MGDSYVVYSPYNFKGQGPASMHFTVTEVDVPSQRTGRLVGELPLAPASILTRDGQARLGDRLYATRCSARFNSCMTAYISIPEALQSSRGEFAAYIVISGLSGAIFGLVWSFFYRRAKSIDRQLRRAIGRDALQVVYQPIVELASRQIVGAEALARWTDEDNFAVGPDVFIRIAEDGGFVGTITELVVRHALRDFAETLRAHPDFRLSVNVAAADLHDPAFLPMMESLLARAEVPARSVSIEITETSTAAHEMARETICRLRDRGHSVHIDDFGTGYSSLSYLHDLAVDAIKIDRTFTRAIGTQAVTIAILPQILALAAALNLDVIVEGIETEQQADYFASSTQPVMAQGWLFGRPVAADPFHRLLAQNQQQVSMLVGAF
jgi:sensor c-di-GMP phosphodiesterase-like protein